MKFAADSSESLEKIEAELGLEVIQLITTLTAFKNRGRQFCVDNGSYKRFDAGAFRRLLLRESPNRERCLFVAVPDVVGSARRTLEVFDHWAPLIDTWPLALVAQDGQEDLPIPWDRIHAIFIGDTTAFKQSDAAVSIIRAAQALDKWTHVGRVNTPERMRKFIELGVDSCDGTGISRYSHMREDIANLSLQPTLIQEASA